MKQATANCPAKARRSAKGGKSPDVRKLKLVPILKRGEPWISLDEALRRARANPLTNHGKRFAMKLAAALNAGKIPLKVWRIGWYVIFGKNSLQYGIIPYAWYVIRRQDGFHCRHDYICTDGVDSYGCLLRPRE